MEDQPLCKSGAARIEGGWCVYFLRCRGGAFYCGISNRPRERFAAHCAGKGAKYTRMHKPFAMRVLYRHLSKSCACRLEAAVKKLGKEEKRVLWTAAGWDGADE